MMANHDTMTSVPRILLVPGHEGLADWQTDVAALYADCLVAEATRDNDDPRRNAWLGRLDALIGGAGAPVAIAAHGLGCLAVAWWGGLMGRRAGRLVTGALLVAPPCLDRDPRLRDFAPIPTAMLPFPAIVASGDGDPAHARGCAADWVSDSCEAGLDRVAGLVDLLVQEGAGLSHYAYRPEPAYRPAGRPVRPASGPVTQRL